MIINIYRIIFGFLKVEFYGNLKERALTLCAQNGINLWGNKLRDGKIECFISVREFRWIKYLKRNKDFRVHIIKKYGLPFVANRYRKRIGILLGAVVCFLLLQFMSGYIWIIDVEGNKHIKEETVLAACESIGITEGIRKNSIYPKAEREKLMLKLDGVAWASINIERSKLTVNISETKQEDEKGETYSNLLASADGIIKKIDIVSGTSVVKVGQAVKKGDLLVSGIVETTDGTRFVKSKGCVLATSEREISLREEFKQRKLLFNGKVKNKRVLELYGFKIPLYLGGEKGLYKTQKSVKKVELFSCSLPIKIYKKRYEFKKEIDVSYTTEKLKEKLEKRLGEMKDVKVVSKEFLTDGKGIELKVIVRREENIAESHKLIINAGN